MHKVSRRHTAPASAQNSYITPLLPKNVPGRCYNNTCHTMQTYQCKLCSTDDAAGASPAAAHGRRCRPGCAPARCAGAERRCCPRWCSPAPVNQAQSLTQAGVSRLGGSANCTESDTTKGALPCFGVGIARLPAALTQTPDAVYLHSIAALAIIQTDDSCPLHSPLLAFER